MPDPVLSRVHRTTCPGSGTTSAFFAHRWAATCFIACCLAHLALHSCDIAISIAASNTHCYGQIGRASIHMYDIAI